MKHISIIILLALFFQCCSRIGDLPLGPAEPAEFSASLLQSKFSVSQMGTIVSLAWTDGDVVGVYPAGKSGNNPYRISIPDVSLPQEALLLAESTALPAEYDKEYYAYCPYDPSAGSDPSKLAVQIPSYQDGTLADAMSEECLVALPYKTSDTDSKVRFSFHPFYPLIQLNLTLAVGGPATLPLTQLSLNSSSALAGSGYLDITSSVPEFTPLTESSTLTKSGGVLTLVSGQSHSLYMLALPGEHEELNLKLVASDNSICEITVPGVKLLPGHNYLCDLTVDYADFTGQDPLDVIPSSLSVVKGEPLLFTIEGTAGSIEFWSGETYHSFEYADKDRVEVTPLPMSFKHALVAGTQKSQPRVQVSSDFDGTMDETAILAASWTDITDKFSFATTVPGDANPVSNMTNYDLYFKDAGEYDICGLMQETDSLYVGLFWHADKYDAALVNTRTASWFTCLKVGDWEMGPDNLSLVWNADKWSGVSASYVPKWMDPNTANGVPANPVFRFMSEFRPTADRDAYAVTNEAFKKKAVNHGHDTPCSVKGLTEDTPASYSYAFAEAGTYEVYFIGRSSKLDGSEDTVIKQFTITVNEE